MYRSICFFILFAVVACTVHKSKPAVQYLKRGEVLARIRCQKSPMHDYAVFVPKNYDSLKPSPVLIFLDSHGKGMYPVGMYKELSEKYHIPVAGSNNIQNGMDMFDVTSAYDAMVADLTSRLNIDRRRIFIAGFSGGARMASAIAIAKGEVCGVIACSAGLNPSSVQTKPAFDYVLTAGMTDMNYSEILSVDRYMEHIGASRQLLVFKGKHEWPPLATMDEAMLFVILRSMQRFPETRNEELIRQAQDLYTEKEKNAAGKTALLEAYRQHVSLLDKISDVTEQRKATEALLYDAAVQQALQKKEKLFVAEETYKQKINGGFAYDYSWWESEVKAIHRKIDSSPEEEAMMYRRILGHASLVSYSAVNNALNSGQPESAEKFLKIYSLVDPENADCDYFWSCFYAMTARNKKAIEALHHAVDKGFRDADKLMKDPTFEMLRNDTAFVRVVGRIK